MLNNVPPISADKWDIFTEPGNGALSFFLMDLGSPGSPFSASAGWTLVTLEHFEKFKMASKMAAIPCTWASLFSHSTSDDNFGI